MQHALCKRNLSGRGANIVRMRQGLAVNPTASLLPCQDHPRLQGRDPATDAHEDLWLTASSLAVQPITSDPFPNPGRCVADVALKLQRQRSMLFQDGDPKMVEWHREIWRPGERPSRATDPSTRCNLPWTATPLRGYSTGARLCRDNGNPSQKSGAIRPAACDTSRRHGHTCHNSSAVLRHA